MPVRIIYILYEQASSFAVICPEMTAKNENYKYSNIYRGLY